MKRSKDYIRKRAKKMIDGDKDRNDLFEKIDDMYNEEWDLPLELDNLAWVRKAISTDPHDSLATGTRLLSTNRPQVKIHPLASGKQNRETVDNIERVLKWQYQLAERRAPGRITRNLTHSALRYDMVCAQVHYLPYQMDVLETFKENGDNERMRKRVLRDGSYSIVAHNPKNVHYRSSNYGLESVLLAKIENAWDVVDFWGDMASELYAAIKDEEDDIPVALYDYTDHQQRYVWCVLEGMEKNVEEEGITIIDMEHDLYWIPWVVRRGGNDIEIEDHYKYEPLLAPIARADLWQTQNIMETILTSEIISYAAAPRGKKSGPHPDSIEVDYGEPGRDIEEPPGHEWTPIPPPQIDRAMTEMVDRNQQRVNKSTVARSLQNLEFPAGSAFATVNAVIQAASSTLDPHKETAEYAIADIFRHMLFWIDYTEDPLEAFDHDNVKADSYGQQYTITREDFDPDHLYIDVKLSAHVPTDYQQRVNTAIMMHDRLNYPLQRAYEDLDVADADQATTEWQMEQLENVELQLAMQIKQLQLQQVMAQQQQLQQPPPQSAQNATFDQTRGQPGFNPAQAGRPPAEVAPQQTREMLTGRTRGGEEIRQPL